MASCKDCKFAKFEFTATGRISRTNGGRCMFGPTFVVSAAMKVNISINSIWPDDGTDCKVFEQKVATAA
ncbi:hypothetical protein RCH05_003597 [Janthinobacterium sp. CAN_S7]